MVVSSRFKEHFEIIDQQDPFHEHYFYTTTSNSSSKQYHHHHNSPQIYYMDEYDLRHQSLSNTIDTISTTNASCSLKRQIRVKPRRHHKREDSNDSSYASSSSVSNNNSNSIVGWCLKQKSKISTKLRHL